MKSKMGGKTITTSPPQKMLDFGSNFQVPNVSPVPFNPKVLIIKD